MAPNEAPYDPYIPAGSQHQQGQGADGNQRTAALQAVSQTPILLLMVMYCEIRKSHGDDIFHRAQSPLRCVRAEKSRLSHSIPNRG